MNETKAASRGSRAVLCVIVLAAQALTLFPAYLLYLFLFAIGYGLAAKTGVFVGTVIAFLGFVAMTFVAVYLATLLTNFPPSPVAGWATLGLTAAILLSAIVIALVEMLLTHKGEPKTLLEMVDDDRRQSYEVAAMIVFIVASSVIATWRSSKLSAHGP